MFPWPQFLMPPRPPRRKVLVRTEHGNFFYVNVHGKTTSGAVMADYGGQALSLFRLLPDGTGDSTYGAVTWEYVDVD